jgi:murein DD-endopeptidase MepM/ murein hydrolase activator NlpD
VAALLASPSLWNWIPAQIRVNPPNQTTSDPAATRGSVLPVLPTTAGVEAISRLTDFHTFMPNAARTSVLTYTVEAGDSLFAIAGKFSLTPETLLWSNYNTLKDDPDTISVGQVLNILPVDGVYDQWQTGSKLDAVADQYGVNVADIISWPGNNLDPAIDPENPGITPGTWLVIPGGHREFHQWQVPVLRRTDTMKWSYGGPGACQGPFLSSVQGNGAFIWPTDSHNITGNTYGPYHHGIDLYARLGDPIYASDNGVVVFSGLSVWGYGNLIVIDHGNGWQTVYAHLSVISVGCGADVYRGDVIGLAGSTGNSTGPHLHFEMMDNGVYVNPGDYLP